VPQKLLGLSPHLVMVDDRENGFQIPVHCVASAVCLKIVPSITDLFKALPKADFVARQGRTRPHPDCFASASYLQGAKVWRVALV
jgi:hypothetical protein